MTGHGVAAAADMALVRGMITALLHSGVPVAEVFSEVSGVLRQRPGLLLATAALAVVDVSAMTVMFATAGHPPPVLRLPDGHVRILDTANAPIIGIPCDSQHCRYRALPARCSTRHVHRRIGGAARPTLRHRRCASGQLPRRNRRSREHDELVELLLGALVGDDDPQDDIAILVIKHLA